MDSYAETIFAPASAAGAGGVCVVRISGPRAGQALRAVFSRPEALEKPRTLVYGEVLENGRVLDECLAVYMPAPRTYTREDVAELHLHASPAGVEAVLGLLSRLGLRMAQPGEFTRRAFINGRIDLSRAEAVMELVSARTQRSAQAALLRLRGGLYQKIRAMEDGITGLLADIAACVDYPEHDTEAETSQTVAQGAARLLGEMDALLSTARGGMLLNEGVRVAIIGRPNVGKSTLYNALLGAERAIVTAQAGTTRDVLTERVDIGGVPFEFMDTAGIREAGDEAERQGVLRARRAGEEADLALVVAAPPLEKEDRVLAEGTRERARMVLLNKCDIGRADPAELGLSEADVLRVSALTGEGLDALRERLIKFALGTAPSGVTLANRRQKDALERARQSLMEAHNGAMNGLPPDLVSIDLAECAHALGEITGRTVDEEVLERVFEKFCIGK